MAVWNALMKIAAQVSGNEKVDQLGRSVKNLQKSSENAIGGFRGLLQQSSGLSAGLGSLLPIISGLGIVGMAAQAINAADGLYDMSVATGVNVSTLSQFQQAARAAGTDLETVVRAMMKVNKALAGNDKDFGEMMQERMNSELDAVKEGERSMTDAVQDQARARLNILEQETRQRLDELNSRYDEEKGLVKDRYDDELSNQEDAAKDQLRTASEAIKQETAERIKRLQDMEGMADDARDREIAKLQDAEEQQLRQLQRSHDRQSKERRRQLQKQEREELLAIQQRQQKEQQEIENENKRKRRLIETEQKERIAAIKAEADAQTEAIKKSYSEMEQAKKGLQSLGVTGRDANGQLKPMSDTFKDIAESLQNLDPEERAAKAFQIFGRSAQGLLPILAEGRKGIEQFAPTIDDQLGQGADKIDTRTIQIEGKLTRLAARLALKIEPVLMRILSFLEGVLSVFDKLPEPMQAFVGGLLAIGALLPIIQTLGGLINGILIAFTGQGFLALLGAMGPGGWIILGIIGLIALVYAFRKQIGDFFDWLTPIVKDQATKAMNYLKKNLIDPFALAWDDVGKIRKGIALFFAWIIKSLELKTKEWINTINDKVVKPLKTIFDNTIRKPATNYFSWWRQNWDAAGKFVTDLFDKIKITIATSFAAITGVVRGVIRGAFEGVASAFNNWIAAINTILNGLREIPFLGLRLLPVLKPIKVPKFAQGGIVHSPTLAMVGDGGESEYIIPEAKMDKALSHFLFKAQGAGALNSNPTINITTGPVVQFGGEQYVTLSDMQAAMQATARGVMNSLRNPSTRISLGLA